MCGRQCAAATTDHGDLMGDHQLMLKGPYHFQGLLRVPMLMKVPGLTMGRVTTSLACTVDLVQTILHLAGLKPYHGMQGHSLVPLLDDPTATIHAQLLIEDDGQRPLKGTNRNTPPVVTSGNPGGGPRLGGHKACPYWCRTSEIDI